MNSALLLAGVVASIFPRLDGVDLSRLRTAGGIDCARCGLYGSPGGGAVVRHAGPLPVRDVTEYTDRNGHWSAETSDPYLHWPERLRWAVQAPALSASPRAAVLERAGGPLGARPARHGQP